MAVDIVNEVICTLHPTNLAQGIPEAQQFPHVYLIGIDAVLAAEQTAFLTPAIWLDRNCGGRWLRRAGSQAPADGSGHLVRGLGSLCSPSSQRFKVSPQFIRLVALAAVAIGL